MLTPPTLNGVTSNRVCNALALLQCVANHNETRALFLNGKINQPATALWALDTHLIHVYIAHLPLYLYPFLNTTSKTRPFEYLRLTSLGVIGALVKVKEKTMGSLGIGMMLRWHLFIFRMTTLKSSAFCFQPRLYPYACVSWKQAVNCQRRWPFSSFKRSC